MDHLDASLGDVVTRIAWNYAAYHRLTKIALGTDKCVDNDLGGSSVLLTPGEPRSCVNPVLHIRRYVGIP